MQTQAIIRHIVQWLKDYAEQARAKGFVVGVSGGIDSAVVSTYRANRFVGFVVGNADSSEIRPSQPCARTHGPSEKALSQCESAKR